jgi:hypothetical protein
MALWRLVQHSVSTLLSLLSLQGGAGISGLGVSIVDALSTLKVMGLHQEFDE